jgi:hypothetical protein
LEWTGHVVRIYQGSTVKKIFESKPEGIRRRGRSRFRWPEDAEKGLREMQIQRRRRKAIDRVEWASVIKKSKALRGPYSQGVSK